MSQLIIYLLITHYHICYFFCIRFIEVVATTLSVLLLVVTFPIAIFFCFKVVLEYERAVIFRLGRLRSGGKTINNFQMV